MADDTRTFKPTLGGGQSFSVTKEVIKNADDYGDIFDIAETMGVDLGGLDDIEDMKTRLLLHYMKSEGEPNFKDVISNAMVALKVESKKKREKLITLLSETKEKLAVSDKFGKQAHRRGSTVIKGFLKSEGVIHNLEQDIDLKLEALKYDTCTVVVSGETSAGKSSILNLLFGEDVVPTFHGSCTSVITRISHNKNERRAKTTHKKKPTDLKERKEIIRHIPPGEICNRLRPYLFEEEESNRERGGDIKEVIIQVPSKILECGIVVVDSPGIGESDSMDSKIVNFVSENQIDGFIYVIKSDNGGGVDEDRLLGLLKVILEQERKKAERGLLPFDSQCAMFVCNMWDLIDEDQQDTVFEHVYQRLASMWPNLQRSQLTTLSARRAKMECDIDPDFIIEPYRNFLSNAKELYARAMDKRVLSTYKWLETILKRSVHHLKTIVSRIDNSEADLERKMRSVWENLQTLKMRSELVINRIRKQIEEETDNICDEFREYLNSPKTKMSITVWIESELPKTERKIAEIENEEPKTITLKWEEVKRELEYKTLQKISKTLEDWEEQYKRIISVKENVEKTIRVQLNILETELQSIEDDMQSETASITSEDSDQRAEGRRKLSFPVDTIQVSSGRQTLPVKVINRVFSPFGKHGRTVINAVTEKIGMSKLSAYKRDPIAYARKRSEKTLERFLDDKGENLLRAVISQFMDQSKEFLDDIERKIPAMVESNQENLDHISQCRKEGSTNLEMYEHMMESMEVLKRTVTDYGEGYIFVNDFGAEDIQIITETNQGAGIRDSVPLDVKQMLDSMGSSTHQRNQKVIQRSLWCAWQNGLLKTPQKEEEPVTIRVYLPNARMENTDAEVAKLRLLRNENVAELLGIQNSSSHPTPAFVFRGDLTPLSHFLKSRLSSVKENIPRILNEILLALGYIHKKKMVHMELNQDTIMIDENSIVRLCGACKPKLAALPPNTAIVNTGDFVYLAPEVLQGELYISTADVYAFGLLVFEIFIDLPFKEQRRWPLQKFTNECKPIAMNGCPYSLVDLRPNTQELIQECLSLDLNKRPTVEVLNDSILDIKDESLLGKIQEQKRNVKFSCYEMMRKSREMYGSSEQNVEAYNFQESTEESIQTIPDLKTSLNIRKSQLEGRQLFYKPEKRRAPHIGDVTKLGTIKSQTDEFDDQHSMPTDSDVSRSQTKGQRDLLRTLSEANRRSIDQDHNLVSRSSKSLDSETAKESDISDRQSPSRLRQS